MWPMLKPTKFVNIYKLSLGIEPTYMVDLVSFTIFDQNNVHIF